MSYYYRFCIFFHYDEMRPIFIDYPEFLQLQGMVKIPRNKISKNGSLKTSFDSSIANGNNNVKISVN
jgi:hypothetical protein